jgi:chemotaxis protein MotB
MRPGGLYPDNWHLSSARAQNFLELLIRDSGLEPWHFLMYALGEYRPIATNDTPEGRQANRRVEVLITRARENPLWDNVVQP